MLLAWKLSLLQTLQSIETSDRFIPPVVLKKINLEKDFP